MIVSEKEKLLPICIDSGLLMGKSRIQLQREIEVQVREAGDEFGGDDGVEQ